MIKVLLGRLSPQIYRLTIPKNRIKTIQEVFQKDNSGAENHTTIFTIAPSEIGANIIWVGTDDGNVQLTQDGGKSWTNTVANIPDLPKKHLVFIT